MTHDALVRVALALDVVGPAVVGQPVVCTGPVSSSSCWWLGLAGASLVPAGTSWSLLWAADLLLFLAWLEFRGPVFWFVAIVCLGAGGRRLLGR